MRLHTASEVISLGRRLEGESADLYERLCRYGKDEDLWRGFAQENRRNIAQVQRGYYSVISDAIEGGFAFDIEGDDYAVDVSAALVASYTEALKKAIEVERQMAQFYSTAAAQSQSLLADIPGVFRAIVQKRKARVEKLASLLRSAE